ncbi:MAG: hypothetical protein FJ109_19270, partial [Deltaproteobacteria bacterium]|nr:hypothetical protein [Deltaproteobacteria bacterium]
MSTHPGLPVDASTAGWRTRRAAATGIPILLAGAVLLGALPASAWESAEEVVHGSARVLEKGETMVGVLSPLGYGVHERVTVFTHPALLLLLTPSLWTRLAILEGTSGLALEAGYQQSWLDLLTADSTTDAEDDRSDAPGYVQLGVVWSQLLSRNVQLNVAGGYLAEFGRAG